MKNKKKIAILYSGGKYFGGIERYLFNLFKYIDGEKYELNLLSLGEWELTDRLKAGEYKNTVFSNKRINLSNINKIGKYLKQNGYNLLVSQGVVANTYARLVSLFYKIPNLVTVHSDLSADYSNFWKRSVFKAIEAILHFPTKKYIAVSSFLKSGLVKNGIDANKIKVVYNGLDFPEPFEKSHKRLVIGSIGRLHPVKGYDLLLKAFAQIENKRLRLVIAGRGDELNGLKKLAADLHISDRVEFVGFVNDVYEFMKKIDVYAQTSKSEGFGLSVAEAMSQNIPVIVTPAGSLKEIVKNGVTGYVSKDFGIKSIAAALLSAVENYSLSKKIGENGRKFVVENFSIEKWIDETTKAYDEAMK